jgi:hypothetical protein
LGIREKKKKKKKKNSKGDAKGGFSMDQKSRIFISKEIKDFYYLKKRIAFISKKIYIINHLIKQPSDQCLPHKTSWKLFSSKLKSPKMRENG